MHYSPKSSFPNPAYVYLAALRPDDISCPPLSGEKPFLCDKCGRGFNRVDNLRSHVKTVHQGKAGMKRLVVAGSSADEGADGCTAMATSDNEINIVTVTTEDIVTLATEALAGSAVAQLTGQAPSSGVGSVT